MVTSRVQACMMGGMTPLLRPLLAPGNLAECLLLYQLGVLAPVLALPVCRRDALLTDGARDGHEALGHLLERRRLRVLWASAVARRDNLQPVAARAQRGLLLPILF